MKSYIAATAVALAVVLTIPLHAAEPIAETSKAECKMLVISSEGDSELDNLGCEKDCQVIKVNEGGKTEVIKLKGDELLGLDDLDAETHLKLLDARIGYLRATAQLKTDVAVKRLEVKKLELAKKPDAEVVARKKEINALKARLADAELDYEQTVKKLAPKGMAELYLLSIGDGTSLLDLDICLPEGGQKRIIKRIKLNADDEEEEDD